MEQQTIMIVDNSELNRMMLKDVLGDQYHYIEAADGRQAIRLLERDLTVDLMLLDVHMPEMDGLQVLEQMNRFHWIGEVPVIMISAEECKKAIERAYTLGATDFIRRPFDTFIVRHRVENTLRLYANQKRLTNLVSTQIYEKEKSNDLMIEILSRVVEFRNHESGEHVLNVRTITEMLLHKLVEKTDIYSLSEENIAMIKTAAALHDIGKITTPEEILNKPGKLTAEEFEIMKDHAAAGARILEDMPYGQDKPLFRYALEICHWHHERWDGHGYPDGLWGEQIPIAAQVVAMADVYDALTNERCYKKAIEQDTAIKMILNGECGAFNPLLLECLTEIAPQLRTAAQRPAEAYPYWSEVSRLSDEVLSQADMPNNERTQRMLESMQERIDFFASCNGGIKFEYDAISGLVDITDWDESPQYRHSVKNVSRLEEFQRMSRRDIDRLQEAMDKTTKENPEFTMSILLPGGEEKRWCDLRVRTLWSERRPEHYVGAVGQLTDPQLSAKQPLMVTAADTGVAEEMRRLKTIFDVVRLVDPISHSVLELDKQGGLHPTGGSCGAFWGSCGIGCANCTSNLAFAQKTTLNKLEFSDTDVYFLVSKYLSLNGVPCVLEMLSKLKNGRWIDANGSRLLLDSSRGESMDLFLDPLTKTYSRQYFETHRPQLEEMECVAIVDVNDFKKVNDTFGRQAGDAALKEVAVTIHACIRNTDILIRYRDNKFLLLFSQMNEQVLARKKSEIQEAVKHIALPEYPGLRLSVSFGGVSGVRPIGEAIRQADCLMYENKEKSHGNASTLRS